MTIPEYQPSALQAVDLTTDGEHWYLVFTREFPQSRASVWAALTEPAELRQWAPYSADRSLATTGPATLFMIDGSDEALASEVTVADAPNRLVYTWGGDPVEWVLTDSGTSTRLQLTQRLAERGQVAMMAAGWHMCLDVAAELLAGSPIGPLLGADALNHGWGDLNVRYSRALGVDPAEPPM